MKIVFMGTPAFAVPMLKAVATQHEVTLVVTQPDAKKGRRRALSEPAVKQAALALGIPVFQPSIIGNDITPIAEAEPDVIVTVAYGQFLPSRVLSLAKKDAINVHASLLPALRGGAPVQRAIERGHRVTGISVIRMVKQMDAGPVLVQKRVAIASDETAGTLFAKLEPLGVEALMDALKQLEDSRATFTAQDHDNATFAYAIRRDEEALDFTRDAHALERQVRAFYPQPNVMTTVSGKRLKVLASAVVPTRDSAEAGTVIDADNHNLVVRCGREALAFERVHLEGKKPMDVKTFMNGAGRSLIKTGMKLPS